MTNTDLEGWYDRTYDVLLLGFMYHDYLVNTKSLVAELKAPVAKS